ncbi:lipoprotein [Pasteurellaceae bacterium LIM206]|nr:lipoprotein [Pasteurellaceae bacterium LIM206]
MKKFVFLLSMIAVLTACSSVHEAKDENTLPDGIMQPVEGTGAIADGGFMPEIQQQSMPDNMK